jgi:two-component system sensor histidine kinase UhpB
VFLTNAAILLAGWAVLAFSPASVKSPLDALNEAAVGLFGLTLMLVLNLVLLRRAFGPLRRLARLMGEFDPLRPGPRGDVEPGVAELTEVTVAFNEMVDRLERERRESAGQALAAQEAERRRFALELHDEIGQSLTGLLLELEHALRQAPPELADDLLAARESARSSLEEVRNIARRLRPEALDDLGLRSALTHLAERIASQTDLRVVRRLDSDLPTLSQDAELVLYRVAQEGLTNAVRHATATAVELHLERRNEGVRLRVLDDGSGLQGATEGAGITGMRERALLVGANLLVGPSEQGGVEVRLDVRAPAKQP